MRAYMTLDTIKSLQGFDATADDARLRQMIEAITRDVDGYVNREGFGSRVATRYFSGNGSACMLLPWDLIAVTTLKEDADGDGVYEETWASTDYELAPYDAAPTGHADLEATRPYWQVAVNERTTGEQSAFARGQKRFELVGKFGYNESTRASGATAAEAIDTSETAIDVSDGALFEVLQTLLVDSEQMYVTAIEGDTITVDRGVNGTTAASHSSGVAISILEVPSAVREAVIVDVKRRWTMERGAYSREIGFPETGQVAVFGGLGLLAKESLARYRNLTVH